MNILTKYKNFALNIRKIYTFLFIASFGTLYLINAQQFSYLQNNRVFSLNCYTYPNQLGIKKTYSISQNNLGILFLSTNKGIISFDGLEWNLLPFNEYSLLVNCSNQIYVFSKNSVGIINYLEPGKYSIANLDNKLPEKNWNPDQAISLNDSIFIKEKNKIWLYFRKEFSLLQNCPTGSYLTTNNKNIFLHSPEGIKILKNGIFLPITHEKYFFYITPTIKNLHFFNSNSHQQISLTAENNIILKDLRTGASNNFNFPTSKSISSVFSDWNNVYWILASDGLYNIKQADYFNYLENVNTVTNPIMGFAKDSSSIFIADNKNVIKSNPVKSIPSENKNLFITSINNQVILVQKEGIKTWKNNEFKLIVSRPIDYATRQRDKILFVSKNYLFTLKLVNNTFSIKEVFRCKSDSIQKVIIKRSGDILLLDKASRINLLLVNQKGVTFETLYDPGGKTDQPQIDNIFLIDENLYLTNTLNIYKLEGNHLKQQEQQDFTFPSHGHFIDYIESDSLGNIWYSSKFPGENKPLFWGKKTANNEFSWHQIPLWEAGLKDPLVLGNLEKSILLFEDGKFFLFNVEKFLESSNKFKIIAQQISVNNKNINLQSEIKGKENLQYFEAHYPSDLINIKFKAINLIRPNPIEFSFLLENSGEGWSPWALSSERYFSKLSPGNYKLLVKAKAINGNITDPFSIKFKVLPPYYLRWYAWVSYVLLFIGIVFIFGIRRKKQFEKEKFTLERIIMERTSELTREKEKTDELLANLLPKDTADELKNTGKASSHKFDMVTVLFSDIQGFTKIAEQMNPEKLIDELDNFFFQFDSVVEKYNIEKIKTIGDAYMAAGGIPYKNRTNPVEVVLAAIEMQEYMKNLKLKNSDIWDLRIGVHTGAVIAGVVGHKRISYDIWGDTVNTASRMESSGEASKVNISGQTYELVKEFFICEYRGKMPVKYKGDIDMYFVKGIRPELSVNLRSIPSKKFFVQLQLLRLQDLEEFIFNKLESEVSSNLYFHNLKHSKDVYTQVELLGRAENITPEEMLLVRTAAILHDIGYIFVYENHEQKSTEIAKEILPKFKYIPDQIEIICELILSTKKDAPLKNKIQEILYDANTDYFGRIDFIMLSLNLHKERKYYNSAKKEADWLLEQMKTLDNHEFNTETAKKLREVSKTEQLQKIKDYLKLYQ